MMKKYNIEWLYQTETCGQYRGCETVTGKNKTEAISNVYHFQSIGDVLCCSIGKLKIIKIVEILNEKINS